MILLLSGLVTGLGIAIWQILFFALPSTLGFLALRRKPPPLEALWLLAVGSIALQAILGTLWSAADLPGATEPFVWGMLCVAGGGWAARSPRWSFDPIASRGWMVTLTIITLCSRLLPAAARAGLGQSDAYSHLQFGLELLRNGQLSNPVYPPAHAWVHTLPLRGFGGDAYLFYRYGGAVMALGLVLAIFFSARRAWGEHTATCCALLAAGCPLFLPLLKTGVGVFANQLGLLFVGLFFWSLPKRPFVSLMAATALAVTVPIMMLDLIVPVLLFALLQRHFRLAGGLTALGALGVLMVGTRLLHLPPEHLERTLSMLVGTEEPVSILDGMRAFILPTPVPYPLAIRLGIFALAVVSALALFDPRFRRPTVAFFPILTAVTGIQTAFGVLQFPGYLRAGWLFLIGLSFLTGFILFRLLEHWQRQALARPLLAASCLVLFMFPPTHTLHLSQAENDLVRFLRHLTDHPPQETTWVWSRPFTAFGGGQGDPVKVLLDGSPLLKAHRLPAEPSPAFFRRRPAFVIIETVPPPITPNPEHNDRVRDLWNQNHALRHWIETSEDAEPWTPPASLRLDGLDIWWLPSP